MTTSTPAVARRRGFGLSRLAWIALVAACLIPLVWPGDIPFINDEPLLIAGAMDANARGAFATEGLLGTFGFVYGPLPVWMYQPLVAVSHDLVVLAVLHTVLMAAATAAALWWLSRSLGLWAWFAPVPLLSPHFWFYARVLWDNPLLIPLGALAIAGYAAHLQSGSTAGLRVSIAAMVAIPLVHLMGVALVAPLAAHMIAIRWRTLWTNRLSVLPIALVSLWLGWPYWKYLATHRMPPAGDAPSAEGWFFPLFGGRLLSATHLAYLFGSGPVSGNAFGAAVAVSGVAYALVWAGAGVALWRVFAAFRSGHWTGRDHIAAILLATLACQIGIDGFSAKFQHPHYYNATWITFVLLAWFSVDAASASRTALRWSAHAATGLLALALAATVAMLAVRLHRTGGTRDIYGPTIANQQRVARMLARYSPQSPVSSQVIEYTLFPHTLAILRRLNAPSYDNGPVRNLEIRYASDDPALGTIELVVR